jgi:hypothetical protein
MAQETPLDDWTFPHGSLTLVGSTLYGMTSDGGTGAGKNGDGMISLYNTADGEYQPIYSFAGPTGDGQDGLDNVFIWNGTIYGMTKCGGTISTSTSNDGQSTYDGGVIYSIPLPM